MFVHILLLIQGCRKYRANKSAREKCAYVCKGVRGSGVDGSWRDGCRRREKERKQGGSMLVAGFVDRNPLRAISGRVVFRGSQNGRHPHQAPPLG